MFVGHYGAALALNSAERRAPLVLLFLGVQFVDLLFFPLVAAGVERMSIIPNATASINVGSLFGPPPGSFTGLFIFAMASYLGFAGLAFWLDRQRS